MPRRRPAERALQFFRQRRITAQLARRTITQRIWPAAPAQGGAEIDQRNLLHAKAPLVGVVADAEVEFAYAVLVQRRHGALDHEPARRAVRPLLAGVTDPDHGVASTLPDSEQGRDHFL